MTTNKNIYTFHKNKFPLFIFIVYEERPESFNEANQKAQLKRMLELEMHPIHGISSKWDYENKKWK